MKQEEQNTSLLYLKMLFTMLAFIYFGVMIVRVGVKGRNIYLESQTSDNLDRQVEGKLDSYLGASKFGMFRSMVPLASLFKQTISDPNVVTRLENEITGLLKKDALTQYFTQYDTMFRPLYLAYMRAVSKQIYSASQSQPTSIVYAASSVDIVTPLLLSMASTSATMKVYMIDNDPSIVAKLKDDDSAVDKAAEKKIIERMRDQFYLLSIFDPSFDNQGKQNISSGALLSLFLKNMGIKKGIINKNQLEITFQNKKITFEFITADITKPKELKNLTIKAPYVLIEKSALGVSRDDYLPAFLKALGSDPTFYFISSKKLNPDESRQMREKHAELRLLGQLYSPEEMIREAMKIKFIPNDSTLCEGEIQNPTLLYLQEAIQDLSYTVNLHNPVTGYHLSSLYRGLKK